MKLHFTLIALMFFTLSTWGQGLSEKEAMLQKCIKLPEVQEVLSKTPDNKVYVMQHSVSFAPETSLKNSDKNLVLLSKPEIHENNVDTFLLFEKFNITSNDAVVEFSVYQDFTTSSKSDKVTLEMTKANTAWRISSKNYERR